MNQVIRELLRNSGFGDPIGQSTVQKLWAGYGEIQRLRFNKNTSAILKRVDAPEVASHPKGWSGELSRRRKIESYQVEKIWYQDFNYQDEKARIPRRLGAYSEGESFYLLMEDMDASGYPRRLEKASMRQVVVCVKWLANFHARFLDVQPKGLWEEGSYWRLATRPEEFEKIADPRTKWTAGLIDQKLASAKYKTIIHGDAKLANFCFTENLDSVAAVDFQYVGAGCPMKDLAYFVSSSMESDECFKNEKSILDAYFSELEKALEGFAQFSELEKEWRDLYPYAWADFYRFLKGWSPEHWKIHPYSEEMAAVAQTKLLAELTEVGKSAARKAGAVINRHSQDEIKVETKPGPSLASSVVTKTDRRAQDLIIKTLAPSIEQFNLGLLTEEKEDDQSRFTKRYFWSVDPLDGTLAFAEKRPGYAVSIALVSAQGVPIIGIVYDPLNDALYSACIGGGAFKNEIPFTVSKSDGPLKIYADRSIEKDPDYLTLTRKHKVIIGAGAVMNAIQCLENPPAKYFKRPRSQEGGGSLWDFAATSVIVKEAGGAATDYYGAPLELNRKESTFLNHKGILFASP